MGITYEEYLSKNGGESFDAFQDRVLEFYASVIDKHLLDPSGMSLESLAHQNDEASPTSLLEMSSLNLQPSSPLRQLQNPSIAKSPMERKALSVLPSPGGIYSVAENRSMVQFGSVSQASLVNVIEKRASCIVFSVVPSNSVSSSVPPSVSSSVSPSVPPCVSTSYQPAQVTQKPLLSPLTIPSPRSTLEASPMPPVPAKPRRILIVTHGGPIELLFSHFLNELACDAAEVHTGFPKGASLYRLKINRITSSQAKDWEWRGKVTTMNDVAHHALVRNADWHQWRAAGQPVRKTKPKKPKVSITAQWLSSMEDEPPVYVTQDARPVAVPVFTRTSSMPATPYPKQVLEEEVKAGGNAIKRAFKRLSDRFKTKDDLPPLPSGETAEEPNPTRKKSLGW